MEYTTELYHHGILGMKWGIRRYQNPDGSLTELGRRRLEKKDLKWADRNYDKLKKQALRPVKRDLNKFDKQYLVPMFAGKYKSGLKSSAYKTAYSKAMAELMNMHTSELATAPSGRIVQFVARRGDIGVEIALTDPKYDISHLKNGVYGSGKVAYKNEYVKKEEVG